ncbi:MAG: hypothetical protein Q7Q71_14330 [Verrucomicrobiota bacterium JB023]|nr:hypothetical protein [Verrucomicrobiota bacterium JB023]
MRKLLTITWLGLVTLFLSSCVTDTGTFIAKESQGFIPALSAPDQFGRQIALRQQAAANDYLLVFFYPEADTPG